MFCWSGVSSRELCWVCVFPLSLDLSGCIAAALTQLPLLAWSRQILCEPTLPQTPRRSLLVWQQPRLRFMGVSQTQLPKAPLWEQWASNNPVGDLAEPPGLVFLAQALLVPLWRWNGGAQLPHSSRSRAEPQSTLVLFVHPFSELHLCCWASRAMCKCLQLFSVPIYSWMPPECSTKPSQEPRALSLSPFTALILGFFSESQNVPFPAANSLLFLLFLLHFSLFLLNSWQEALSFLTSSHFCQVTLWVISPNK